MTILLTNDVIKNIQASEPDMQSKVAAVIQNLASLNLGSSNLAPNISTSRGLSSCTKDSHSMYCLNKNNSHTNHKINLDCVKNEIYKENHIGSHITDVGNDVYTFKSGDFLLFFTVIDESNVVVLDVKNYKSIENKKIKDLRSKLASAYSDALYENAKNTSRKIIKKNNDCVIGKIKK